MLHLFERQEALFVSRQVLRYEREADAHLLRMRVVLYDASVLEIRDYLFQDGSRKYAYHWMEANGRLRRRWDNAPHWPDVATAPHHLHIPEQDVPVASTVTNLEDLVSFMQDWFAK